MQRGFLLSPQQRQKTNNPRRSTSVAPQCEPKENAEGPKQKRRVATRSSDLLKIENNHHDALSLFQLDEGDHDECDGSIKSERLDKEAAINHEIISNAQAIQPLVIPSATISSGSRKDVQRNAKRPMIVEIGGSHDVTSNEKNADLNTKPLLVEVSTPAPSKEQTKTTTCCLDKVTVADEHMKDDVTVHQTGQGIQPFVNGLSLLLSRLHRDRKYNDQRHGLKHDDKSFFHGTYMNITTEMEMKSFITKHFNIEKESKCETNMEIALIKAKVGELLKYVLEPIVQDYSANSTSIHTKKRNLSTTSNWNSPPLAAGLCLLAYSNQKALVYDSLKITLLDSITSDKGQPDDDNNKQKKMLALGAIYLLRCWIRCMSVKLTSMEAQLESNSDKNVTVDSNAGLLDMESASESLLLLFLPVLEKIVSGDSRRTVSLLAALDACFEMIEFSARVTAFLQAEKVPLSSSTPICTLEHTNTLARILIWKNSLSITDRLLVTKQNWVLRATALKNQDKHDDEDSSTAKSKCLSLIVDDWREMIKLSKRRFFDYLVDTECPNNKIHLHDGADFDSFFFFIWNMAGTKLKRASKSKHHTLGTEAILRIGGIAQSLCHNQECTTGYDDAESLCDFGGFVGAEDLVWSLQEVVRLRCNSEGSKSLLSLTARERSTIRSFTSWLPKRKKNMVLLSSSGMNEEVIGTLLSFLRLDSKPCVNMSLASISLLWEQSPILNFDEMSDLDCTRKLSSFLGALRLHASGGDEDNIDPTTETLCALVCKATSQKPHLLLPLVMDLDSSKSVVIVIVMNMLEHLPDNKLVQETAIQSIIENVDTLATVRARIQIHRAELCRISCNTIVSPCLDYLTKKYSEKGRSLGVVSISMLLRDVMFAKAKGGLSNEFVKCVLAHFQVKEDSFTTFLDKNISVWRSSLLEDSSPPTAFNDMVSAAAIEVIGSPSSSMHLSLLSSLTRIDGDITTYLDHKKEKLITATSSILDFATAKISEGCQNSTDTNVFTSIAPLLVLRCFPQSCYQLVHQASPSSARMVELTRLLSGLIRVQAIANAKTGVGKQERMLVAEIAGHCLSLSYLFNDICSASFLAVLRVMRNESQLTQRDIMRCLVESKSALYAICHRVPLAPDEDDGSVIYDVAFFAMEVLNYNTAFSSLAESLKEEIIMLQSGCVNYLAVVLDSLSRRRSKELFGSQMVQEMTSESHTSDPESNHTISVLEALSKISNELISAISTGRGGQNLFRSYFSTSLGPHNFSPNSRTAILNSLVVLLQMSQGDDSTLKWIARWCLPSIIRLVHQGPIDDSVHHPLCIAAGFQVVYTLLARLGSFDWIEPEKTTDETQQRLQIDFVCLALRCALNSFESNTADRSIASVCTLRVAALKLMLSVLAIYQATLDSGIADFLKPTEIQKAIKAVGFAAVSDEHPDVRRLASEIVPQAMRGLSG